MISKNDNMNTISLAQFRQLFHVSDCLNMGDDLSVINVRYDSSLRVLSHPSRFDGYLAFFCISGHLNMMINLTEFEVQEDSLFINLPGNIIRVSSLEPNQKDKLHFIVMAMTRDYMSGLKMNINKLIERSMFLLKSPCMMLTGEQKQIARGYLKLAGEVLRSSLRYKRECISSLLSSIFYLAGGVMEQRIAEVGNVMDMVSSDRSKVVFDKFINLIYEYHMKERGMAFYADKLCITPKYLSKLVKNATGKSAPDWIDAYVILEAKNMLKYSDLPVKEIVSRLNFPNSSSFHKFFKAKTGMTPVQYRKM